MDGLLSVHDVECIVRFVRAAVRTLGQQGAGLCLDGLQEARDRLAAPLPPGVEARLAAAAPVEASRIFLGDSVQKRDVLVRELAVLEDWRARLRLLREHAFRPAAFMKQRYGIRARAVLPFLYLHRLVSGAWRWVRA